MIVRWPAPPGDKRAAWFIVSELVATRAGVIHRARCKTLGRSNLHHVRAANLAALPHGSRLCRRCMRDEPRQLALDLRSSTATHSDVGRADLASPSATVSAGSAAASKHATHDGEGP